MALVEIMRLWSEGVAAAESDDWNGALKSFNSITDPRAKICFNIGCCHLVLGNLEKAQEAFTLTIERDKHLAVGYFQRGFVYFQRGKYNLALQDWSHAYTEMRGNQLIDYKILGLLFKLYSCEILHNIALAYSKEGNWAKAEESMLIALSQKVESRHSTKLEKAMEDIVKEKVFAAIKIPKGRIFQPNERLVEQLEKKDYLGKALVVASVVDKDSFSGFAPLQSQGQTQVGTQHVASQPVCGAYILLANNSSSRPKTPEILRTLEGEPHRVLFKFNPETAEEMQVLPGNIVFVLKKGDDNWATVVFNGKKGIVPCNYLEPVELRFQSAQQADVRSEEQDSTKTPQQPVVPAPPAATPPQLPKSTKDQQDISGQPKETLQVKETIIKVEELQVQRQSPASDKAETFVTALYDYEASQPEDLPFHKGDVIKILSHVSEDWWEGEFQGKVGIFPRAFVEEKPKESGPSGI